MDSLDDLNLAIVSDLHLSEGRNPKTRKFHRNEDFFFDSQFDRFLSYLEVSSVRRGRKWRLVIAGDMVDFLQITMRPEKPAFTLRKSETEYGLGTSPEKTVWKIKVMMDGHWIFFQALGRFLVNGHRVVIVAGNHDIEWNIPEVQKSFRDEMKRFIPAGIRNPDDMVSYGITFCPWFYYEPGLIWVEHGHQYDGINAFDYLLYPYLPGSDELMLPGGSFFVRYLFNKVEQKHPFADQIKPISAYLKRYWHDLLFSLNLWHHIRYFLAIFEKVGRFHKNDIAFLEREHETRIHLEAERCSLDINRLNVIRGLWIPCFLYNRGLLDNIVRFMTYSPEDACQRMASAIQKELNVRYVIMGHTHGVDLCSLTPDGKSEYANSGTWTTIFSENPEERLLHEEKEFVFVEILKDEGNRLELLKWRDDSACCDRVNLFE
jgi:UDP-2,3-diacylglucosamine pyrophosphatase LpxH